MKARSRSLSGAGLMLLILPIFAGLLACMPEHVPLGNPDRARIDPDLSGIWFVSGGDEFGSIAILEAWDKHTWALSNFVVEEGSDADLSDYDLEAYDGFVEALENEPLDSTGLEIGGMLSYKTWLSRMSGEYFMTLEMRGLVHEDGSTDPLFTMDYRIINKTADEFSLKLLNEEYEALKEAPATTRAWEKVIRRNMDDDDLYTDGVTRFQRVRPEHIELIGGIPNMFYGIF